jgi:uncharacterized protein (DUF1015 family)
MVTITPVRRALVSVDSSAATRISAPNYDEFQSDLEVWEMLEANPTSILRVTMAHCDERSADRIGPGDTPEALARAVVNMKELRTSALTEEIADALWVYEIQDPRRRGIRQIGVGGNARTSEIRTDATPDGTIIRNEGIRESKARGRADLIQATRAITDVVNNAVDDTSGELESHLLAHADATAPDFEVVDERGNRHRVWIVRDSRGLEKLQDLLAREPYAYVADGNHRSAAAAMLGYDHFLGVFFPARTMGIRPYNRLVHVPALAQGPLQAALGERFTIEAPSRPGPYEPARTHDIGLYRKDGGWLRLRPIPGTFDPSDAAEAIDSGIVQKNLFEHVLGITSATDDRLTFVGSNKDVAWLMHEVDEGRATYAVSLPAVTMAEFIEVCRQNRRMPPKSTWFEPKTRSGLVMALLDG